MYVDVNSIEIDGVSMAQYLVEAKFGYNKLWASDSGRNLSGKMTGTLLGIFPKLTLQFRKLTQAELIIVSQILDSSNQTTVYYDPYKNANVTLTTYTGDWEVINKMFEQNQGFSCAFISVAKRV